MGSEGEGMFDDAATRDRIFRAALSVFAERGFSEATVDDIVTRAGIAKGTIYYHFPSKEVLFRDLLEAGVEALRARVIGAQAEPPGLGALAAALDEQVELFLSYRDFYRLLVTDLWWLHDRWPDDVQRIRRRYLEPLADVVRAAQALGEVRSDVDPDLVAPALFGVISHVTLHLWLEERPDAATAKTVVRTLCLNGLRARPAAHVSSGGAGPSAGPEW
jgi:AcrR family transcriptional regulator